MLETFADRFLSQRRYPQAVDRTFTAGLLHHPTLDQFSFLAGIPTVDDHFGLLHQLFYGFELLFVCRVTDQLDPEPGWDHREGSQAPSFPVVRIIVGFFKSAQMSEGPGYLVPVSFHISIHLFGCPENFCDFARYTGLFSYTYLHP